MNEKLDKFTAARIRRFTATGMAVQKGLPFERPRFGGKPQLMMALPPDGKATAQHGSGRESVPGRLSA